MKLSEEKQKRLFMRNFFRKTGKAIYDYRLIEDGDRVLVGVSGGKDSLALLEVLALRARNSKQKYTVLAAHIDVLQVGYKSDSDYLQDFCRKLGVEYIYRTVHVDMSEDPKKPACFVCSWHRRKVLFEIAQAKGCNKLALGHHRDDAVESLLMSMIFNATINSIPGRLELFGGKLLLIRPFIYISNKETIRYAEYQEFRTQEKCCPYEKATQRDTIRKWLDQLEETIPHVRNNIFAAMQHICTEYLP